MRESGQLRDDLGENLNRIAIFVRGKMAQEDILGDFTERGIYANYLIGELRVDGLDTATGAEDDHDDDSATSSRQRIVEDDPRYVALKIFIGEELKHLRKQWSDLRVEAGVRTAREIPEINEWIKDLPKDISRKAKRWLGKLNRIDVDDDAEQKQLLKHAVIGFEFYLRNKNLDSLEKIRDENIEAAIRMFHDLDILETTLYGQIVQQRIAVIRHLQDKVDRKEKERVIQQYIFDHLWLLDPSWERAEASEVMEARVGTLFSKIDAKLSDKEKNARLDIKYRKTAGKHVIIELKRPGLTVSVYNLGKQIHKYRSGMAKILRKIGTPYEPVEFVCLLDSPPTEASGADGQSEVEKVLGANNARYVTYDQLLENALQAYSDYLRNKQITDRVGKIIEAIDDYAEQ